MHNPYIKTSPSIHQENPQITKTIGKNEEKPNVEIESGELVLKNDLSGVYKAIPNNKHYQGGVKTYLPEGSFVFSDDNTLALNEDDHDIFEIKKPSKFTQKNNTPAKVLQRNFKPEEYNAMVDKISDAKTDDITKRTAGLMLSKYEDVLGKIAFIQEGKKNFPNDIPEFAQDVAPVYDTQVKNKIMEQKQYMKKGGFVNPYLTKFDDGGYTPNVSLLQRDVQQFPKTFAEQTGFASGFSPWKGDKLNTFKNKYGYSNASKYTSEQILEKAKSKGYNGPADNLSLQQWILSDPDKRQLVDAAHRQYGMPNAEKENDSIWGIRWDVGLDALPDQTRKSFFNPTQPAPKSPSAPPYDPLKVPPNRMEPITWGFNPYQKMNLAADALQYASVRQEFPYRSQIQSPLVELERQNPQSALNQISNQTSQEYRNNSMLNPYMASGNNSQVYGRSMDAMNQTQAQYNNQNSQIANQQNITNNGIQRQDQQYNVGADQQYYKEGVEGRKNYNNLKDVAFNNLRGDFNTYVGENQSLAYSMAQTPYAPYKYNFNTGQFELTGNRQILDAQGNPKQDLVEQYINKINFDELDGTQKINFVKNIIGNKALQLPNRKKGGMIKNPYLK